MRTTIFKIAGLGLALILLTVIGASMYRNTSALLETEARVAQSYEILARLEALALLLNEAETGQRGFVITGEEPYLEPYRRAAGALDDALRRMEASVAGDGEQGARLAALRPLAAERMRMLGETIDLRRTKGFDAAQARITTETGKDLMDAVRARIADMERIERRRLEQRSRDEQRDSRDTRTVVLTSTFLTFVALAAAAGLVLRDNLRRGLAERTLRRSEDRYRRHFQDGLTGNYVAAPAGELKVWNPAFARMMDCEWMDEALVRRRISVFGGAAEREGLLAQLQAGRTSILRERMLIRADGRPVPVIENLVGVFDDRGRLTEIHGYCLDRDRTGAAGEPAPETPAPSLPA